MRIGTEAKFRDALAQLKAQPDALAKTIKHEQLTTTAQKQHNDHKGSCIDQANKGGWSLARADSHKDVKKLAEVRPAANEQRKRIPTREELYFSSSSVEN